MTIFHRGNEAAAHGGNCFSEEMFLHLPIEVQHYIVKKLDILSLVSFLSVSREAFQRMAGFFNFLDLASCIFPIDNQWPYLAWENDRA